MSTFQKSSIMTISSILFMLNLSIRYLDFFVIESLSLAENTSENRCIMLNVYSNFYSKTFSISQHIFRIGKREASIATIQLDFQFVPFFFLFFFGVLHTHKIMSTKWISYVVQLKWEKFAEHIHKIDGRTLPIYLLQDNTFTLIRLMSHRKNLPFSVVMLMPFQLLFVSHFLRALVISDYYYYFGVRVCKQRKISRYTF